MKKIIYFILIIIMIYGLSYCKSSQNVVDVTEYSDSITIDSNHYMSIQFEKGEEFNHPTFVIWKEDLQGNYINTIYITKSYASGIFGHKMVGDSIWLNTSGESIQPAALPYWTHKKGLIDGEFLIPSPSHPFVDAYTGATQESGFNFKTGSLETEKKYKLLMEVNQTWDWNKFWNNNKYPSSKAYKFSAQPSVIYSVEINSNETEFYFNPIGHGDPTGETGKLYTNLTTLTTAKEIFSLLKVEFITQQ